MEKIKIVKSASTLITSIGVGAIVGNGVKITGAYAASNPLVKVCIFVAEFAISGLVSEKACAYMDKQIDEVSEMIQKVKKEAEKEDKDGES